MVCILLCLVLRTHELCFVRAVCSHLASCWRFSLVYVPHSIQPWNLPVSDWTEVTVCGGFLFLLSVVIVATVSQWNCVCSNVWLWFLCLCWGNGGVAVDTAAVGGIAWWAGSPCQRKLDLACFSVCPVEDLYGLSLRPDCPNWQLTRVQIGKCVSVLCCWSLQLDSSCYHSFVSFSFSHTLSLSLSDFCLPPGSWSACWMYPFLVNILVWLLLVLQAALCHRHIFEQECLRCIFCLCFLPRFVSGPSSSRTLCTDDSSPLFWWLIFFFCRPFYWFLAAHGVRRRQLCVWINGTVSPCLFMLLLWV